VPALNTDITNNSTYDRGTERYRGPRPERISGTGRV